MQQKSRPVLSLGNRAPRALDETTIAAIVGEAIRERRCLTGTYNNGLVRLAPYVLFARHNELFVDGVVIDRDGKPPREQKLATFKLKGLGRVRAVEERFQQLLELDLNAPRYAGAVVADILSSRGAE